MIEKMHEKSNGVVFKVIFALVSISFVLGGIGSGFMMHDTSAVKVNGEEISQQAFSQAKSREQNLRNTQEGEEFWDKLKNDPAYAQAFQDSVFNSLINDRLLRQYADTLKLGISDAQVKSQIVNNPNFHQNGKFDNGLYLQTLRNNGIGAEQYAAFVAEGMLMSQLQEGVINSEFTVPAQQDVLAKLLLQTRQISLATLSLADEAAKQQATEAEIQAFYEKNSRHFVNPEQLTVEYITFSPKALESKIQVDQTQIETYYETNKAKYVTAGESRLAHIQVATQADADAVLQALKNGEDFAKAAKEKSQDKGSANQGGDLGWAKSGTYPPAFEEAANRLQSGQFSDPVAIDGAFHIIKVLNRKDETVIPLESVKAQIADTIRNELLRTEFSTVSRAMAQKAMDENNTLEGVAQLAGIAVQRTEPFDLSHIPSVLNHEAVLKALNSDIRKNGQNSEAIELGNAEDQEVMFLRVSHYQPETVQPFEQAKQAVTDAVKQEKAAQQLQAAADEALKTLISGGQTTLTFGPSENLLFAQAQLQHPLLANTVFAMPKPDNGPTYQQLKQPNGDLVIVRLESIKDGDNAAFQPLLAQLAEADRVVLFSQMLNDLRSKAKIEINSDFAEQELNGNE